jgi:hypothetical protein
MAYKQNLTFFCEMPSDELKKLFANGQVIKSLKSLNANLSLGLLDFSAERAAIVKQLTKAGIPVTAWLLLPKSQGYWTSLDSVADTVRCYANFKAWTAQYKLQWAAVGLDIEPRIERMKLFSKDWASELPGLITRLFGGKKYDRREHELNALIDQIRLDGYAVETYNFPFVIEERKADSRLLAKALGTPPLEADREVLMLYSSFFPKDGDAILWSYAHQAQAIGLGSTGGGVELENGEPLRSLRWLELRRDLLIAKEFTPHLYLFSLEGCVQNGMLEPLTQFDWEAKVTLPTQTGQNVSLLRWVMQGALWLFSHPMQVLIPLTLIFLFARKKK